MRTNDWSPADGWNAGPGTMHLTRLARCWEAYCIACKTPARESTRDKAMEKVRSHKCPPGTLKAFPTCPTCGVTTETCLVMPGEVQGDPYYRDQWHQSRIDLWIEHIGDQP